MASILKVDAMQGVTAAGDITITSEGGAATQSLQQGLAKLWSNVQLDQSTSNDSFNVSSTVDSGVGKCRRNATNAFSQDPRTFAAVAVTQYDSAGHNRLTGALGTSVVETNIRNTSNTTHDQPTSCSVFGDLA